MAFHVVDSHIINYCKKTSHVAARFALFVVFFWFGALKVIGESPASGLVRDLFESTIPFMQFETFLVLFGLLECIIGILFLIKGTERVAIALLVIHMITTFGPLVLLPEVTWSGFLIPTMEGQYIIKNLVIVALAIGIVERLEPTKPSSIAV